MIPAGTRMYKDQVALEDVPVDIYPPGHPKAPGELYVALAATMWDSAGSGKTPDEAYQTLVINIPNYVAGLVKAYGAELAAMKPSDQANEIASIVNVEFVNPNA